MSFGRTFLTAAAVFAVVSAAHADAIPVNSDNFIRAESDLYFTGVVGNYGFGKIGHERGMTDLDNQTVIRLNRDTLYSAGVFDLEAGPVTITMPEAGDRFTSLQVIDEDHYTHGVHYGAGTHTFTREEIGTRYVVLALRILANPADAEDLAAVHALQDLVAVEQPGGPGTFDLPEWDKASQDRTRATILQLGADLPDTRGMFGSREQVDPVRHFIGSAMAWGGNPETEALYLNRTAPDNSGDAVYRLTVDEVPVKGFWSVTIYNAEGFITPNDLNAYTLNNLTAKPDGDGSVTVQFGGCDGEIANCLPTPAGWNWMVRLYRPDAEILDGSWVFPDLEPVK